MHHLLLCLAAAGCAGSAVNRPEIDEGLSRALTDAKRERDRGNLECAFARVENARRKTAESVFVFAFDEAFLGKPPLDPAKPLDAAKLHIARAEWAQAEPLLRQVIAAQPDTVAPVFALSGVLDQRGDSAGAAAVVTTFVRTHPTSTVAILRGIRDMPVAQQVPALEAAVADHPTDGEIVFALAAAVQAAGDLERATGLFEHAAELAPADSTIQAFTGRFFLKAVNKPDRALPYYYRAYFLDPSFYETEFVESRIHRLMDKTKLSSC